MQLHNVFLTGALCLLAGHVTIGAPNATSVENTYWLTVNVSTIFSNPPDLTTFSWYVGHARR